MIARRITILTLLLMLGACASAPPPVIERLDESTGATITLLNQPLEVLVEESGPPRAGAAFTTPLRQFILLSPLDVNRAGQHTHYAWVSLITAPPEGINDARVLNLSLGGEDNAMRLPLVTRERYDAGLREPIYSGGPRWDGEWLFALTLGQLRRIAEASSLTIAFGPLNARLTGEEWLKYQTALRAYVKHGMR